MEPFFKQMTRREFLSLVGSGVVLAALPPGCSGDGAGRRGGRFNGPARHVIVISLDTARADFWGCYGNRWIRTPNIDRLADESILFNDCMTVAPTTLASHTALFTGKYPHTHGTPRNGFMVSKENVMLAEVLQEAGFHTAGFLGSFALDSRFDFAQGFDVYDEEFEQFIGPDNVDQNQRPAQSVTDAVTRYLDETGIPSNLFLFAHYFDPHSPYKPPARYCAMYGRSIAYQSWLRESQADFATWDRNETIRALCYAGEITYTDEHVGRLIDYLRQKGILDESIVVVTSDHGENFKEHYLNWDHGFTVYQTTMQSVCMIRLPGAERAGTTVEPLFSNIDIFPTLLAYLGLDAPDGLDGEAVDLAPTGKEISFPDRIRFGEATKPHNDVETDPRWNNINKARCVRAGNMKYIRTPYLDTEELYDLSTDPFEQTNLLIEPGSAILEEARALRERLEAWTNSASPLTSRFEPAQREETMKRLRSLGYLK